MTMIDKLGAHIMRTLAKQMIFIVTLFGSCNLYAKYIDLNISNNTKYNIVNECVFMLSGYDESITDTSPSVTIEKNGSWPYLFSPGYMTKNAKVDTTCYFNIKKSEKEIRYVAVEFETILHNAEENPKVTITLNGEGDITTEGDTIYATTFEAGPKWYNLIYWAQ